MNSSKAKKSVRNYFMSHERKQSSPAISTQRVLHSALPSVSQQDFKQILPGLFNTSAPVALKWVKQTPLISRELLFSAGISQT